MKDIFCEVRSNKKAVFAMSESIVHENPKEIEEGMLDFDDNVVSVNELEKKNVIECEICQTHFSKESSLKTHIATVHQGKKTFKCSICDYKWLAL